MSQKLDTRYCQSYWHINIGSTFYSEAYFESTKDFWQIDTPSIDTWTKKDTRRNGQAFVKKVLKVQPKAFFANFATGDIIGALF